MISPVPRSAYHASLAVVRWVLMISDTVAVFDTTLRDGQQAAETRLGSREKLMIASNWRSSRWM